MEKVIIKISGELFASTEKLKSIIEQIKKLHTKYQIGLVVGAGNIFRGNQNSKDFGIQQTTGDNAGMLATIINGLILKDLFDQQKIDSIILTALPCPEIAENVTQEKITNAIDSKKIIIFVGGTGNPFFTTDTNAVLRGLQINASMILKGTKIDGVFDKDPIKDKNAKIFKNINCSQVIEKNLQVMDLTSIALAQKYNLKIKVFNLFEKDALIKALEDPNFGSTIS